MDNSSNILRVKYTNVLVSDDESSISTNDSSLSLTSESLIMTVENNHDIFATHNPSKCNTCNESCSACWYMIGYLLICMFRSCYKCKCEL